MSIPLRQNTAAVVPAGPFQDAAGVVQTGLSIAQADCQISKNGAAYAQKNSAVAATHQVSGVYAVTLNATDTNTLGTFRLVINVSGALVVWETFEVLSAQAYDALYGTGNLNAAVQTIATGAINAAAIAAGAIPTLWTTQATVTTTGTTTTFVSTALTESATDHWKGGIVQFVDGALAGQARLITGFNSTTDTITYTPATTSAPQLGTAFRILPNASAIVATGGIAAASFVANAIDATAISAGAITSGKFGSGAITNTVLASNAIGATQLATGAITAAKFAAGAVDAAALAADGANKFADHLLRRSLTTARASANGDAVGRRSVMGGLAKLVNKWSVAGTTLTVTTEDDTTSFYTQSLVGTAGADPVTSVG